VAAHAPFRGASNRRSGRPVSLRFPSMKKYHEHSMKPPHTHPAEESKRLLKLGILLSFGVFFIEFGGGLWTHSLALVSDAWHVFIDIWSLVISLLAVYMARRPVNDRKTFGLHRIEVLAATLNGLLVFAISIGILYAAWHRFHHPTAVRSFELLIISSFGLLMNLGIAALFWDRSHRDMNIRGAFLHILGDALNTVAVMIAALLMLFTDWPFIDPMVSAVIAVVVLWGSGRLLKEALNTLLEGVPRNIDVAQVEKEIVAIAGVSSVHDLHVWSICSHINALSGHVLLAADEMANQHAVLERIGHLVKERFGIVHSTIQVESKAWPSIDEELVDRAQNG
jgi:cobalt-zinc-cadmium efflux system protein